MSKKHNTSSTTGLREAFDAATRTYTAPEYAGLRPEAQAFFDSIVKTRVSFNEMQLVQCATLANLMQSNAENMALLVKEGNVIETDKGAAVNPRHKVLMASERLAIALAASLQVNSSSVNGRARDSANRHLAAQQTRDTLDDLDDDSRLIPGLRSVKH